MYLIFMEKYMQITFINSTLHCPRNTPGYILRLQTSNENVQIEVVKQALLCWSRLNKTGDTRYPKLALKRLIELHK